MKHYSPIAAQQDFQQVLTAVHQLQETIMITPTDSEDEHAAVIMPKREWEALRELSFLQRPSLPKPAITAFDVENGMGLSQQQLRYLGVRSDFIGGM